jgi:hypothetical protein
VAPSPLFPVQSRLAISRRSIVWLMLPFLLWLGVTCALWGMQYYWVSSATERVMGLDLSERWVDAP